MFCFFLLAKFFRSLYKNTVKNKENALSHQFPTIMSSFFFLIFTSIIFCNSTNVIFVTWNKKWTAKCKSKAKISAEWRRFLHSRGLRMFWESYMHVVDSLARWYRARERLFSLRLNYSQWTHVIRSQSGGAGGWRYIL